MRKGKTLGIRLMVTMACLFLISACGGGGGGGGTTPTTGSGGGGGGTTTETATISGSVSGTTIVAVNDSGDIVASDDTAGKTPDANGNYPFTLTGVPVGQNIRVYLITSGGIYPMYFDSDSNGDTNVFSLASSTTINLGFVDTDTTGQEGKAIPQNNPTDSPEVSGGAENPAIPTTITNPEPPAGSSLNQLITDGLEAVSNGWTLKARNYFKAAVDILDGSEGQNDADTARFFYALTRVAAISADTFSDGNSADMNSLGDILDRCGALPSDTARANWDTIECLDTLPSKTPDGSEFQKFLYEVVLPEIEGAIANLGTVSPDFNKQWREPFDNTIVESDRGDALFFKAELGGLAANLYTLNAYNLGADIAAEVNDQNGTVEDFLNNYGSFLSLTLTGSYIDNLNSAQTLYSAAFDDLNAAIVEMVAETDNQDDDLINLGDRTPSDITEGQTGIANYKASLFGATTVDDNVTPSDPSDDTILNLSIFFTGLDFRTLDLLPPYNGDTPGFFPDAVTFKEVFVQGYELNEDVNPVDGIPDILQ